MYYKILSKHQHSNNFPVFAITAITKISNLLNLCKLWSRF